MLRYFKSEKIDVMKKLLGILVLGFLWCNTAFAQFLICETMVKDFSNGDKHYDKLETYKLYKRKSDGKWCAQNLKMVERCNRWHDSQDDIQIYYVKKEDKDWLLSYKFIEVNRYTGKFVMTHRFDPNKTALIMYAKGTCSLQDERKF